ncbi:MAG: IS1380 family transposase [Candidatus Eisenbacteria bacterium]|uniref:IS1380 family transposase n=1 Tax=Eiseniibacteriota bacterium TaxID=2212470 RepID=A0A956SGA4_UNCEI|nr:IS1380 family transposase [Candidatus Eisenbacteria bacterium]
MTTAFDLPHSSSDGGGILLRAADQQLGLIREFSQCLVERREPGKVAHGLEELVMQRVFGMACGYADANDAARLKEDPVHRLLVGIDPRTGNTLASQPTLSRFENGVNSRELYWLGWTLGEVVIDRHRKRVRKSCRRVTVDLDVTDDPAHGNQQFTMFNGFYDANCYLPLLGFLRFDDEPDQFLFTSVLRPGNAPTQRGVLGVLGRVLPLLRDAFPKARILVRLDGGFACSELFDHLDAEPRVDYIVGMAKNERLLRISASAMKKVKSKARDSQESERIYGEGRYQARKWSQERRILYKAEIVHFEGRPPKENPRFVVTNMKQSPRFLYEKVYCYRGEIENRIKELHYGVDIGRTSCHRFLANQFRVFLTAAAYVLLQEIRLAARGTSLERAQASTIRERLLKVGAIVTGSVRRVLFRLPDTFPFRSEWLRVATTLGASTG